jgi:GlpG protein
MNKDNQALILVSFQQENIARLLIHFLMSKGVDVTYQLLTNEEGHAVLLNNLAQKNEAIQHVHDFLSTPDHRQFQQSAWESGQAVTLKTGHQFDWLKVKGGLLAVPLTSLILCICLIVYIASSLGGHWAIFEQLQMQSFTALMQDSQWWRLLGPAFFHFGALHVTFNLLWWWTLGKQIESVFGFSGLLIIFCITAIIPNVIQYWISGPNFGGLSGVVYGLVGFVWWIGWLRPNWGLWLPKPMIGFMLVWLVLGYTDILWVSVANSAHTSGLISGCVLAFIWSRFGSANPDTNTS